MIRRLFIFIACALCAYAGTHAQTSAADSAYTLTATKCFVNAPTAVLPVLSTNTRLDMLDYFSIGDTRGLANGAGGNSHLIDVQPLSLTLELTESGATMQFFVLNPRSSKPLIGVIETLQTPMPDSKLSIYSSSWEPQAALSIEPTLKDWLLIPSKEQLARAQEAYPFITAKYAVEIGPDEVPVLSISPTIQGFFVEEEAATLPPLKESLTYRWDGKRFK